MKFFVMLFLSTMIRAHGIDIVSVKFDPSLDRERIDVEIQNTTQQDLICEKATFTVTYENPSTGLELKTLNLKHSNFSMLPNEKISINLGQEITDDLKQNYDVVFIRSVKYQDDLNCRPLNFSEYLNLKELKPSERKFLEIIKRAYKVLHDEQVEEVLSNNSQLFVAPTKQSLKDPKRQSALNSPMSLSLLRFFPHLESITIQSLGVESLDGLQNFTQLKVLDVSGNKDLADISAISRNYALKAVDISGTAVTSLDVFKGLSNLRSLSIKNARVSDFGWLLQPNELECVVFDKLKIKSNTPQARDLIRRSKQVFDECADDDIRSRRRFLF